MGLFSVRLSLTTENSDYIWFQELFLGKELLANVPVSKIASKYLNSSKIHVQSDTQCLRLWRSTGSQTFMYFANGLDNPKYMEYDSEYSSYQEQERDHRTDCSAQCFRINESKSNSTVLYLEVQQPAELSLTSTKRQGSVKSLLSSPTLSSKSSRNSTKVDVTSPKSEIPGHIDNLSYLIITFTEAKGESQSTTIKVPMAQ